MLANDVHAREARIDVEARDPERACWKPLSADRLRARALAALRPFRTLVAPREHQRRAAHGGQGAIRVDIEFASCSRAQRANAGGKCAYLRARVVANAELQAEAQFEASPPADAGAAHW